MNELTKRGQSFNCIEKPAFMKAIQYLGYNKNEVITFVKEFDERVEIQDNTFKSYLKCKGELILMSEDNDNSNNNLYLNFREYGYYLDIGDFLVVENIDSNGHGKIWKLGILKMKPNEFYKKHIFISDEILNLLEFSNVK